jgi:hypothetical protein
MIERLMLYTSIIKLCSHLLFESVKLCDCNPLSFYSICVRILNFMFICFRDFRYSILVAFGIIAGFLIAFVIFFQRLAYSLCQFLDLLFYWYKWFWTILQGCSVFLELITALLSSTVPSSVVLRFLLGTCIGIVICCTEIELQIFG